MRLLVFLLPVALLIPAYPSVSVWWFRLSEPKLLVPLKLEGPLQIRSDPYGEGHFGAPRSGGRKHRGVDLVAPIGTEVLAAKSGIARIGALKNGMGRYVEIRHPDESMTRYAHLKTILVRERQWSRRGQAIGLVGKSGNARRSSIQPHLHFELLNPQGEPVDPLSMMEAKP